MNGVRWTSGIGIAVGGVSGALVALLGVASPRAPAAPVAATAVAPPLAVATLAAQPAAAAPEPIAASSTAGAQASAAPLEASAAAVTSAAQAPAVTPASSFGVAPALELPQTREALLKAELYCDKRQDFDECTRAAVALEAGTTGPPDPEQARRFRRIALTHLVAQCEAGAPHACFVMAAKYRAGGELVASPMRAKALEERGLELCRLGRSAPECPPSPL